MANERDRPGQGSTTSQMQQRVERETESARQSVQNLGESARNQAEATASDLQTEARKVASEQKEVATSSMMDIASAIRRAADDLEAHQQPQVAGMARSIAAGIEDFSQSISRRNFQDMLSEVQRFARDHPTVFFGGALIAGLAIARFAKSSREHGRTAPGTRPYTDRRTGSRGQLSEVARAGREYGSGAEATR